MKELLKSIIYDQQALCWKNDFIQRDFLIDLMTNAEIVVISGIRRCGKSTLLHQIRNLMDEKAYYFNFDDDRLVNFTVEDFQLLNECFYEIYGIQKTYYFDEIQNISGWERFIRRLHDYGNKIFLTGSNANMLSKELGTHLTGRYCKIELFPFSFKEFLIFNNFKFTPEDFYSTKRKVELSRHFNDYFIRGGFPLFLSNQNELYLKSLYESILYRDVMVRNRINNEKEVLELVYYLASNVAKLSSYNNLTKIIDVKNPTTIRNYIDFLQNTYLLFQVSKYDFSLKKQLMNPKKTYFIDNALITKIGFLFSDEKGRLLENMIFIELKRRNYNIYYHSNRNECDFVIKTNTAITHAIQVCYSFDTAHTKEREIKGLLEAMNAYQLDEAWVVTNSNEENIEIGNKKIKIIPAWKFLLSEIDNNQ